MAENELNSIAINVSQHSKAVLENVRKSISDAVKSSVEHIASKAFFIDPLENMVSFRFPNGKIFDNAALPGPFLEMHVEKRIGDSDIVYAVCRCPACVGNAPGQTCYTYESTLLQENDDRSLLGDEYIPPTTKFADPDSGDQAVTVAAYLKGRYDGKYLQLPEPEVPMDDLYCHHKFEDVPCEDMPSFGGTGAKPSAYISVSYDELVNEIEGDDYDDDDDEEIGESNTYSHVFTPNKHLTMDEASTFMRRAMGYPETKKVNEAEVYKPKSRTIDFDE